MSEAPERIWMDPDIKFPECEKQYGCDIEYVRADRIEELEAKLAKVDEIMVRRIKYAYRSKKSAGSTSSKQREHIRMHALSDALGEIRTTLAEQKGGKE